MLLAAQQIAVLQLLGKPPTEVNSGYQVVAEVRRFLPLILTETRSTVSSGSGSSSYVVGQWRPRWKMVFIWQCPFMFLSYSVSSFLIGLTLFVCTPLIRRDAWSTASDVSLETDICGYTAYNGQDCGRLFSHRSRCSDYLRLRFILDLSLRGS